MARELVKLIRKIDPNAAVASLATGIVIWLLTTFATIELVNSKHADAVAHTDSRFQETQSTLKEIKETVQRIDERVWEISRRKR
jgi:peptidoglycan hydrolase CwlO-like protein